jgi:hypothetical protein
MDNLSFFLIIFVVIIAIYWIHTSSTNTNNTSQEEKEGFAHSNNSTDTVSCDSNILTLNPYERCKVLGVSKFMVRDINTNLWLTAGLQEGFNKFLPGRFGVPLVMSDRPDEYLPLRTVSDPNDYLLATYSGDGIRTVSNPYNSTFVIQVFIYNGYNVLGYINEGDTQLYLSIDSNGNISSTPNPSEASVVEIVEV